jgi:hypothetical protein
MKKPRFTIKVSPHVIAAINYEMPPREYLTRLFPNNRFADMFLNILIEGKVIDPETLKCKSEIPKSDQTAILRYLRKYLGEEKYSYPDMAVIGRKAFGMDTTGNSIRTSKKKIKGSKRPATSKSDILTKLEGL